MVMVNADGRIVMVNAQAEILFGYGREDLIGQPVELLVPERSRAAHPTSRRGFLGEPSARMSPPPNHISEKLSPATSSCPVRIALALR